MSTEREPELAQGARAENAGERTDTLVRALTMMRVREECEGDECVSVS